jgi:hypothetical protein
MKFNIAYQFCMVLLIIKTKTCTEVFIANFSLIKGTFVRDF